MLEAATLNGVAISERYLVTPRSGIVGRFRTLLDPNALSFSLMRAAGYWGQLPQTRTEALSGRSSKANMR